jgi:FLVCR family feline leukemia virus subgroup C receptor-related protein
MTSNNNGDNQIADTSHLTNNNNHNHENVKLKSNQQTQVYGKRWLILWIFIFLSASNAFQWIEYSIITDVVCDYYSKISIN